MTTDERACLDIYNRLTWDEVKLLSASIIKSWKLGQLIVARAL